MDSTATATPTVIHAQTMSTKNDSETIDDNEGGNQDLGALKKFVSKIVPTLDRDTNGRIDPKVAKFYKLLYEDEMIDLNQLKMIAWGGIPYRYRPLSWRLLLGYLPVARSKREQQLTRKREEYERLIEQYYNDRSLDDGMWRQIHIDIPRMQPLIPVFQNPRVQVSFERILYIWSIRHPASGYVQGMNDLVTPFFLTYLSEYCDSQQLHDVERFDISSIDDASLRSIEADTYWSFGKLLDSIQNNYTHAQPGIQRLVKMLATVVSRVDADLHNHLKAHGVDYLQFAFRWMNNLLIRELPLRLVVRLWDSYLAEGFIATFTPPQTTVPQKPPHQLPTATSSVSAATAQYRHNQNILTSNSNSSSSSAQINTMLSGISSSSSTTASVIGAGGGHQQNSQAMSSHENHHAYQNPNSSSQNHPITSASSNSGKTSSWHNGSETPFSASFHLFVCAAFLKSWSKNLLREQDFQGIMLLLQNLPTYHWSDQEIVMMLADAYHMKEIFSPSHLKI